jgi:hypothetical protein
MPTRRRSSPIRARRILSPRAFLSAMPRGRREYEEAPLVSTAQRLRGLGRRQVLDGPRPELLRVGFISNFRPHRSDPAQLKGDEVSRQPWPWPEPRGHSLVKAGLAHCSASTARPRRVSGALGPYSMRTSGFAGVGTSRCYTPVGSSARGGRHDEAWTFAAQSGSGNADDSRKHGAGAAAARGSLGGHWRLDGGFCLGASIRMAADIQTPREVWLGKAARQGLAQLGREQAERHLVRRTPLR